jgi:predicted nucleotidyltransferase
MASNEGHLKTTTWKRMPGRLSLMQNESSGSVTVFYLDGPATIRALKTLAREIRQTNPDVLEISLFGSLARGDHSPGSDADLFILVQEDGKKPFDRIPRFLRLFLGGPIGTDVLAYTPSEVEEMRREGNSLLTQIEREKVRLA